MKLKGESIQQLRESLENTIEKIRETCTHPKLSVWMEKWWAIAHTTGYAVRLCERCGEEMDRKRLGYFERVEGQLVLLNPAMEFGKFWERVHS